ncbi:MAG TPA: hypothetical protein VGR35_02885 [Tepidisphaeraceae bacterium]|nr:hypothetical protein [Tepidisphaeraceae bacterium]
MAHRPLSSSILYLLLSILSLLPSCTLIGIGAQALPPATIVPQYKGFAGQTVGMMVWADRGMRIEWEFIQLDLANAIQSKLDAAANPPARPGKKKGPRTKVKELQGTKFPIIPASIIRFQQDHPEIDGQPITEIAPRLGVSRLIYVEIEEFDTRPDGAVELFRGDANVTLRVVEVAPDGTGKVAYEENDVRATFPPKSPKEGRPSIGDRRIYVGLIDALGDAIAKRFIPYPEEE